MHPCKFCGESCDCDGDLDWYDRDKDCVECAECWATVAEAEDEWEEYEDPNAPDEM